MIRKCFLTYLLDGWNDRGLPAAIYLSQAGCLQYWAEFSLRIHTGGLSSVRALNWGGLNAAG